MVWLFSRIKNDPRDAIADLDSKARQLHHQGRYAEAEPLYRRSLMMLEQELGLVHPYLVDNLNKLVTVLSELGYYSEAVALSERSLEIIEQHLGSESFEYAKELSNLGLLLVDVDNFSGAEQSLHRSYVILKKIRGSGHPDVTISQINLAGLLYMRGSYLEAEPLFRSSLLNLEQQLGPEHPSVVEALNNLASCLHNLGNYVEAEPLYQRSLAIREKQLGLKHPDVAFALNNLADLLSALGNIAEAVTLSRRSLAILEEQFGKGHIRVAKALRKLGIHLSCSGDYTEAEQLFRRSLTIMHQHLESEHLDIVRCQRNLANSLFRIKKYAEAEQLCRLNLAIQKKKIGPDNPEVAFTLNDLAVVLKKLGNYTEAEPLFCRSLAILEQWLGSDHPNVAKSLMGLALLFDDTDRTSSAILCAKRAVNILQKTRQNISNIGEKYLQLFDISIESFYDQLADFLIKTGRYGEAEYVMGMLKDKELLELLRRDIQCSLEIKSIAWNSVEKKNIDEFDEITSILYDTGKQIGFLKQIKTNDRLLEQNRKLATLEEKLYVGYGQVSDFLGNLSKVLPKFDSKNINSDSYKIIDLADTTPSTVAVFTISSENSFQVIMKTAHGYLPFPSKIKAMDLSKKVIKFRELLKDPESDAFLPLAKELYDIIILPMEQELNRKGIESIIWMLSGALRILPLSALHDGKRFMLEKFSSVCITTISSNKSVKHKRWSGLGMGTTREHDGHQLLPSVKNELEGIISDNNSTGVIPGKILLDEAFTRVSMQNNLKGTYKAVHFASHFELNPANETMSYLLLGDGSKIRMDELRDLPQLFKGVDLVAFSACSTGLGTTSNNGREVDGIGYLGELQGSNAVLATLWPVEDSSTSMLMREFYRKRENGSSKRNALQRAQQALLKGVITSEEGHDFTHPYFWAPFILIGNGR